MQPRPTHAPKLAVPSVLEMAEDDRARGLDGARQPEARERFDGRWRQRLDPIRRAAVTREHFDLEAEPPQFTGGDGPSDAGPRDDDGQFRAAHPALNAARNGM